MELFFTNYFGQFHEMVWISKFLVRDTSSWLYNFKHVRHKCLDVHTNSKCKWDWRNKNRAWGIDNHTLRNPILTPILFYTKHPFDSYTWILSTDQIKRHSARVPFSYDTYFPFFSFFWLEQNFCQYLPSKTKKYSQNWRKR